MTLSGVSTIGEQRRKSQHGVFAWLPVLVLAMSLCILASGRKEGYSSSLRVADSSTQTILHNDGRLGMERSDGLVRDLVDDENITLVVVAENTTDTSEDTNATTIDEDYYPLEDDNKTISNDDMFVDPMNNDTIPLDPNNNETVVPAIGPSPSLFDDSEFVKYDLPGLQDIEGILVKVSCPTSDIRLRCLCPVGIRWTIEPIVDDSITTTTLSMKPANILIASIEEQNATLLDRWSSSTETYKTLVFQYTEPALLSPPPPYTGVRLQVRSNQLKYVGVTEGNRLQIRTGIKSIQKVVVTQNAALFANVTTTSTMSSPLDLVLDRRALVNMSLVESIPVDPPSTSNNKTNNDNTIPTTTVTTTNTSAQNVKSNSPVAGPVKITMRDTSQLFLKGTVYGGDIESRSIATVQGNILDLFVTGGGAVVVNPYPPNIVQGNPCDNVEIARFAGTCDIDKSVVVLPRERAVLFNNTAIQCGGTNVPVDDEEKTNQSSAASLRDDIFGCITFTILLGLTSVWITL